MIQCIIDKTIRLEKVTNNTFLTAPLVSGNSLAHMVRLRVLDSDGDPADLTGISATGAFNRPDGHQVTPINVTITGNVVECVFPASCYTTAGRFRFMLDLNETVNNEAALRTAFVLDGLIEIGPTGSVVDPGTPVPNIQAAIANAQLATTAANTAAQTATTAAAAAQDVADNVEGEVSALKSAMNAVVEESVKPYPYLYKKDTLIDMSLVEQTAVGFDTYFIPCNPFDILQIEWEGDTVFWNGIIRTAIYTAKKSDDTLEKLTDGYNSCIPVSPTERNHIIIAKSDYIGLYVTIKRIYVDNVFFYKNDTYTKLNAESFTGIKTWNEQTKGNLNNKYYCRPNAEMAELSGNYRCLWFKLKQGEKLLVDNPTVLLGGMGDYYDGTGTTGATKITTSSEFIANTTCAVCIYTINNNTTVTLIPVTTDKISADNIMGLVATDKQYSGLNGVAFGTSLTYRAQTTGGFLQYLPDLSGITFDNQGVGSATILDNGTQPNMLDTITNYAGWSGKRVCLLEGFVNDWYYNGALLGTWKDTGTATVCGCVRSAITHILTQNPNLTLFLILDHFGKGITAANALNSANQTQLEFYQEIEKVALSMGVRVIREFELSEISQLTPQYLLDNIHMNELGAKQSADAIWSAIKITEPNRVSV